MSPLVVFVAICIPLRLLIGAGMLVSSYYAEVTLPVWAGITGVWAMGFAYSHTNATHTHARSLRGSRMVGAASNRPHGSVDERLSWILNWQVLGRRIFDSQIDDLKMNSILSILQTLNDKIIMCFRFF